MSNSSKRSYEERTSSYKRHFGEGPQRFAYTHPPSSRNTSTLSSRVFRFSSATGDGTSLEPSRAASSCTSRTRPTSRAIPVSSGMEDISMMSGTLGPEFQGMRVNEKEELKTLNTRLAGYIQKVRALEQTNQVLEAQIDQLNASQTSRLNDVYEDELSRLRLELENSGHEKASIQLQLDNAMAEAGKWKQKFDEEVANNRELESDLSSMRKDCDDATIVRLDLERRLETLQEEIEFLKNLHDQEMSELQDRIRKSELTIEPAPGPDLEELLEDMRLQYEKMAARNKADSEQWYQEKVEALQQQSAKNDDQMRHVRTEIGEYRKTVQTLKLEIDSLRGTNDSLQRALSEMEQRSGQDAKDYQDTIDGLQNECDELKAQMTQHLRQYQELMNVKLALDMEIATYRKLLEGEESRLSDKLSLLHTNAPSTVPNAPSTGSKQASSNYSPVYPRSNLAMDELETVTTKKVVVKTIETKDGKVVSQTEDVREHSSGDHGNE